jgi:LmbE family N-acetylglucosaminyl deacetylase
MSIVTKMARRAYRSLDQAVYDRLYGGLKIRGTAEHSRRAIDDLPAQPTLLVVAHPDDEALGTGALLTRLTDVSIVIATDGTPTDGRAARAAGFDGNDSYRQARVAETASALALIGRGEVPVFRLGIPDQEAVFRIARIVPRLKQIMQGGKFKYVVTHPYEGGNPDHDATSLAVHAACLLLRKKGLDAPIPVDMTSYHLAEGRMVYGRFLPSPGAGPVETFCLDADQSDLKRRMLECYRTQSRIVDEFPRDAERFRMAPVYDFLKPPHTGPLGYETYLWRMDGGRWRRAAGRALNRLGLLEPS